MKSFDDLREFRKGVILVLKSPTPVFAPYYADAGAIVSETGGALSHGAIVAREFGIPMISGMTGLFEKFHSGEMVEVDTQSGTITKLNGGGYVSTNPELGKQSPITF